MIGLGDGYWLNYNTNEYFLIDEHEHWLRKNYDKVGVKPKELKKFVEGEDRIECLLFILNKYPLVRVREHGTEITFEFMSDNVNTVLWSIYMFLKQIDICGDYTGLNIVNINKDSAYLNWMEFQEKMKNDEFIIKENNNKITLTSFFGKNKCLNFDKPIEYKSKFNILFESIMKNNKLK